MRLKTPGVTIGVTVLLAALALAGCADEADRAGGEQTLAEAAREPQARNREIQDAVNRLVVDCMEEEGFMVHPNELTVSVVEEWEKASETAGPVSLEISPMPGVPTVSDAVKEGFGSNVLNNPELDDEVTLELNPFYEEPREYQDDYALAQHGQEYIDWQNGDGEVAVEGGCTAEVGEAVFGSPVASGDEEGSYQIVEPTVLRDIDAMREASRTDAVTKSLDEMRECVADADYPYIEGNEDDSLGFRSYVDAFYVDNQVESEYQLPSGAPWSDFDEAFAAETAFAEAAAQCADDSGYRKTSQSEWDKASKKLAADHSDELYAWSEEIDKVLDKAKDLLGR